MQSTLSLTLDLTTKKGFFTDITDYAAINVDVAGLGAMGSVQVYFQGTLVDTLPINLGGVPSTWVSTQFDLELDVNGEVANGSYSAVYTVSFDFSCGVTTTAPTEIIMVSGPTFGTNYQGFSPGASITISNILPGGSIIDTSENQSGDLVVNITGTIATGGPSTEQVTVTNLPNNFSWVYAGCNMVESKASLVADCDYGDFGTFTVSNETNLEGVTLEGLTVDINYPSWTNEATITETALPFTQNNLATGTYSVELTQQIEKVQNDGLIINYEATCIQEFKVTCSGSLCGLNECIENLRKAHEAELLKNKVSKYQVYVDNILVYYMEAQNYKACGEMDKYRAEVAKIEAQLDASGCDCGCCDENVYKWVQNTSANAINIIASITQLQEDVNAIDNSITIIQGDVSAVQVDVTNLQVDVTNLQNNAVQTANNGLTKAGTNVALGGTLTQNTSIITNDQSGYKFIISDASSNSWPIPFIINDNGANNSGIFMNYAHSGLGAATTGVYYNNIAGNDYSYNIYVTPCENGGVDPEEETPQFKVYGDSVSQKGKVQITRYGQGNLINNTPAYFLGVLSDGSCVEIAPANVGPSATASNGLNKVANDIKLGGTLTANTQIGLSSNQFDFYSNTGTLQFSKNQINAPASTRAVQIKSVKNGAAFSTGQGPAIDFSVGPSNSNTVIGSISSTWNNVGTDSIMGFDVYDTNFATTKFKIYGNNGVLEAPGYGLGNLVNNSPQYLLGVLTNGEFVEVDPASVGAPLVYAAKINGSFSAGVSLTEISNSTGATFTIAAYAAGYYEITCSNPSLFNSTKAVAFLTLNSGTIGFSGIDIAPATAALVIETFNLNGSPYDIISHAMIKIEIYP